MQANGTTARAAGREIDVASRASLLAGDWPRKACSTLNATNEREARRRLNADQAPRRGRAVSVDVRRAAPCRRPLPVKGAAAAHLAADRARPRSVDEAAA